FLLKLVRMRFSPFSGTDQGLFLAVPGTEDDRAFWAPAAPAQLTNSLSFRENGNHTADRIFGAIHTRLVMIAPNHPIIGPLAAAWPGDDIVCGYHFEIELHFEMPRRLAGT